MALPNIKDLLTSFSPSSEFFAISSGDGRIKIWNTAKGLLQTEFADLTSADTSVLQSKSDRGHLSLDYTCMQWVHLDDEKKKKKKKKKKPGLSLLVLGTGSGDVLALDVAAGQLKWKVSDCHAGGVTAVTFARHAFCIYTAGVDGMVCQIDSLTGSLMLKFRSSTKAISSLSISADGKILAAAAGQLKVFSCSDNKKIQKFSGHPVGVRCMIFSEDGKYILSSGVGERFIAFWKINGGKMQHSSCVLSMEHPAISLDVKGSDGDNGGDASLYVLAISEIGLCYFWYGKNLEEMCTSKPTMISLSVGPSLLKNQKCSMPAIYSAKFQYIERPASGKILFAYGSMIRPSFEKFSVEHGTDINLKNSQDGILVPIVETDNNFQKDQASKAKVIALDRANAEDAILPRPKLYDRHDRKRKHSLPHSTVDLEYEMIDPLVGVVNKDLHAGNRGAECQDKMEEDNAAICIEDRLKSVGILASKDDLTTQINSRIPFKTPMDTKFKDAHLLIDANMPAKKIKETVVSMASGDALKFLEVLLIMWKTRSANERDVLPWIRNILVNHGHIIISQESSTDVLDTLHKMTKFKCSAFQSLLQLSGRLQLITTQIDKAGQNMILAFPSEHQADKSEDEDTSELVYGLEDDTSQSGSDGNNLEH